MLLMEQKMTLYLKNTSDDGNKIDDNFLIFDDDDNEKFFLCFLLFLLYFALYLIACRSIIEMYYAQNSLPLVNFS